jgi:hypothetical protein
VQCAEVGVDAEESVVEEGVGTGEAGEFAPAHAGVCGGDDEDLVGMAVDAVGDGVDLAGGGVGSFGCPLGGDLDVVAGVVGEAFVVDVCRAKTRRTLCELVNR